MANHKHDWHLKLEADRLCVVCKCGACEGVPASEVIPKVRKCAAERRARERALDNFRSANA